MKKCWDAFLEGRGSSPALPKWENGNGRRAWSTEMAAKYNDDSVVDIERRVLQALCQGALHRRVSLNALRSYRWRDPLNRVIFDFFVSKPGADAKLMREQLPAHLTRRGFPDFDLSWFQLNTQAGEDVERLIQLLSVAANPVEKPVGG